MIETYPVNDSSRMNILQHEEKTGKVKIRNKIQLNEYDYQKPFALTHIFLQSKVLVRLHLLQHNKLTVMNHTWTLITF